VKKLFVIIILSYSILFAGNFKISYDPDYAPFSFAQDNKAYGLLVDIWKEWAKTNHHTIEFIKASSWDDAIELAQKGQVDFFLGTTPHQKWMKASKPFYKTKTALFIKKDFNTTIQSIGIIGDDYKKPLQNKFKNVNIISYDTYTQLINALIDTKVNAIYDDTIAITYYTIENHYTQLIHKLNKFSIVSNVDAISNSTKKIKIFENGFEKIPFIKLKNIEKNWIYAKEDRYFENKIKFTKITLKYVYDPHWKPFEYKDPMSHIHKGIIADILSLISSNTSIKFEAIPTDSWSQSIEMVKNKKADMFSAIPYTKEGTSYLNFTKKNIYSYPAVLLSTNDKTLIMKRDLENTKIGIIKGNSLGKWISHKYPKALFIEFRTIEQALDALKYHDIDYFGINGVTALYYTNVLGYKNLKIHSILDYMFHLKIALRNDLSPEIIEYIDESLSHITNKEFSDIYHKWTSIKVKKELDIKLLLSIISVVVAVFMLFLFINKRLKHLVAQKTKELKELNENLEATVEERTKELVQVHKNIQENIKHASLIQNAILPNQQDMYKFFKDCFIIYQPRDIVGGDIYFFNKLDEDRAYLFVIDCTGHGVSGAFVTMLTKAIQEQLSTMLHQQHHDTSMILSYFNRSLHQLINQTKHHSNIGFDACVVYIDKVANTLEYAGANIPLYYVYDNSIELIKPDRYSVGYYKCDINYAYTSHTIDIKDGMKFYITTDGYIDQNGGDKSFPFGKKEFKKLILDNHFLDLNRQKQIYQESIENYRKNNEQTDDITFIGFEI